jgi:hypothetical protein
MSGRFKRIRLADRIAHAMIEQDYGSSIMWGDGLLNDVAYGHVKGRRSKHPLDRQLAALDALERAPDLFQKHYIRLHTGPGERLVRSFKLIGTPRPLPTGGNNV